MEDKTNSSIRPMVDLNASSFDRVNTSLQNSRTPGYNYHDKSVTGALKLRSATISEKDPNIAYTVFDLEVTEELCNPGRNLHGGAVALIFDMCTSMAILPVAREGFWDTGHVSRTLNCTYLRPAPCGSRCTVESEVVHLGKRAGMLRGVIRNEKGAICYTCEHGKAAVDFRARSKV